MYMIQWRNQTYFLDCPEKTIWTLKGSCDYKDVDSGRPCTFQFMKVQVSDADEFIHSSGLC